MRFVSPVRFPVWLVCLVGVLAGNSSEGQSLDAEGRAQRLTLTVDGLEREALVFVPAEADDTTDAERAVPVVFGFHGHGGNARHAAWMFGFQKHWPEALVVYMQGVPTPGRLSDPEGKRNGWQHDAGEPQDRDLAFFDEVLSALKRAHRVDETRIYATGHSNGGAFTYLLWSLRPEVFAAVAPSAASSRRLGTLTPKPAMHIAGRQDELVRFAWQERAMAVVKRVNGCSEQGEPWAKDCVLFPSETGAPFVAYIHDGTHKYPEEAPELIVKFFKEQVREQQSPAQGKAMTANKRTVQKYMAAFGKSDHAEVLSCLTDDVEWIIPGMFHVTGKAAFDQEIENDAFVGSPTITVTRLTEENGVVVAEGHVRSAKKDGGVLNADFCDVFVMRDGKIRQLISYVMETRGPL